MSMIGLMLHINTILYPYAGFKLSSEYEMPCKKVMQVLARAILRHRIGLWETKQAMGYT
jgi:hypothetical protein